MDRASDSGSEGWGFESLPAYQKYGVGRSLPHIFVAPWDSKDSFATVRRTVAAIGEHYNLRSKLQRVPPAHRVAEPRQFGISD